MARSRPGGGVCFRGKMTDDEYLEAIKEIPPTTLTEAKIALSRARYVVGEEKIIGARNASNEVTGLYVYCWGILVPTWTKKIKEILGSKFKVEGDTNREVVEISMK